MEKSILKFEKMTNTDLQEIQGGAIPLLIPIAAGFVKGFVYTGGAILTTRALLSGNQEPYSNESQKGVTMNRNLERCYLF